MATVGRKGAEGGGFIIAVTATREIGTDCLGKHTHTHTKAFT